MAKTHGWTIVGSGSTRWLLLVGVLGVLALTIVLVARSDSATYVPGPFGQRPPDAATAMRANGDHGQPRVGTPPGSRTPAPADRITIRGRVLRTASVQPVAGAPVELKIQALPFQRELPAGVARGVAAEGSTGPDGRFALDASRNRGYRLLFRLRDHDVVIISEIDPVEDATEVDLGIIYLGNTSVLCGRVVDPGGNPVGGVQLNVVRREAPNWERQDVRSVPLVRIAVGADGWFASPTPLTEGTWVVLGGDCTVLAAPLVVVDADSPPVSDKIVITVNGESNKLGFAGVVHDVDNRGISGIRVWVDFTPGDGVATATAADGSFSATCKARTQAVTRVQLFDPKRRFASGEIAGPWPVGSENVRLPMSAAPTLRLTVVDESTGEPVVGYTARLFSTVKFDAVWVQFGGARDDPGINVVHCMAPDGVAAIPMFSDGRGRLLVTPDSRAYTPTSLLEIPASTSEFEVRLAPSDVMLAIEDANGAPIAGASVVVEQQICEGTGVELVLPLEDISSHIFDSQMAIFTRVFTGESGLDGTVLASVPSGPKSRLWLRADGHADTLVDEWKPARMPRRNVVVMREGGSIAGRILNWRGTENTGDAPARVLQVSLERVDNPSWRLPRVSASLMPATGSAGYCISGTGDFAVAGVPVGRWRVWSDLPPLPKCGSQRFFLGEVDVRAGETSRIEADAGRYRPGRLLATVEYDGRPFVGSVRVIATNRMGAGPYFTDRRGRFEAELRPGTYSISLDPTNGTNGGKGALTMIEDPCTFEVRAEQPTAKTLHVLRRTVTLEFDDTQTLDPDAEFELVPVDGRRLAIRGGVAGQAVLFESPPRGAFTVRCAHYPDRPELRGRSWGPFRVECSQADAVFRVPLEQ